MEENGSTRDDLKLPTGTDEADKLAVTLKDEFAEGKEIVVTVLKVRAMPTEAGCSDKLGAAIECLLQRGHTVRLRAAMLESTHW